MARIRTIKPEFPQSESMGRVSRDARLCFVLLWTLADDAGRLRGSSELLAGLLFPFDSDALTMIEKWLSELDREQCIRRYRISGTTYIEVCKWLSHQKIDRPSASRYPPFDEASRILANPREASCEDLGPGPGPGREKDLFVAPSKARESSRVLASPRESSRGLVEIKPNGTAENLDSSGKVSAPMRRGARLSKTFSLNESDKAFATKNGFSLKAIEAELEKFRDHWFAESGAKASKLDWNAAWRTWIRNSIKFAPKNNKPPDDMFAGAR